jgi:hypothetical protein
MCTFHRNMPCEELIQICQPRLASIFYYFFVCNLHISTATLFGPGNTGTRTECVFVGMLYSMKIDSTALACNLKKHHPLRFAHISSGAPWQPHLANLSLLLASKQLRCWLMLYAWQECGSLLWTMI